MPPSDTTDGFPRPYGKYELLDRLGDGGMAEVFLARLPGVAGFRKTVVIKRILPHLARKKRFIEMFVAEASLAAEVRHRNVVQVHELGRVGDELYMAMEYVKGTDLRVLLGQAAKRGLRIPTWFSVHVVCEVLEALGYAWTLEDDEGRPRRIVHRDVTPSNIFISEQGEVKLGDFGVARDDTRESQTRAGQLKGKLAYMAPEQLYSKPPDHRVDVFAAGVVLWEALAQRRLFGGRPEIEVMQAITQQARRAPSEHVGDIPHRLDAIVLSALEIDKNARLDSAQEFQNHLLQTLPSLRAQIRPHDVQLVVSCLLGQASPADAKLESLSTARSSATPRHGSAPRTSASEAHSFSPSSPSSEDLSENPLAAADPPGTPDLVQDLLDPSGAPRAPRSYGSESTAERPRHPKPRSQDLGLPVLAGQKLPDAGVSTAPSGRPLDPSQVARNGLLSKTGTGNDSVELPGLHTLDPQRESQPAAPSPPSTAELDMEALVGDAVSAVEKAAPTSNTIPKDHMLAGIEHRRLLDNSRQLKSERWSFILDQELYEGNYPFWIKDHEDTEVGPCSFEQGLQIVKVEVQAGLGPAAFISTSRGSWLSMHAFLQMSGMENLVSDGPPSPSEPPSWSGTAEEHTIASVLAALTRAGANGRLILETELNNSEGYRVIEVARGRPTYVWAAGPDMQIPQLLVSKRVIHRRLLPQVMHEVLARRQPLGKVLSATAGLDIRRYFPMLMKERMSALLSDGYVRFAFDANHSPQSGEPFAKTLLAPVSELAFRVVPTHRIENRLRTVLSSALEPVRDFSTMVQALAFKTEHVQIADRLARGKRLGRLLDSSPPAQARVIRTVAYILLESELLRVAE